ncbi:hypothetical protein Bca52824_013480 [Brassica carinata]|uniref:Uncharacterized protein n=1 Tax=Brassica carinata TaxID=52824 RepID=A0A8X7VZM7_BRACI|nr:hypothetical protein Bca52824_013480 [Brassica carinata]
MTPPPTKLHELWILSSNQDRARSFPRSTDNNKAERVSETRCCKEETEKTREGGLLRVELDAAPFNHRRDSRSENFGERDKAASAKVSVGSHVWVEDPDEAWIDGEVEEANTDEITVNCSGKKVVTKVNAVYPKDPEFPELGVDDMTKLAYLHEPGLLLNLKCRYDANEIYTYTGNILIAVNPFKRLPHLYGIDTMKQYKGAPLGELTPHPFAVADSAYRKMINEGVSQAILVSGESGAGKTESTKMLMRFLAYMGGRSESEGRSVEQQVLESNPVLEAFGNAKTVRNNNSSRFGKFVEIQFDQRGRISGAAIRTYLLERSRVCQVSDPERNYHCFYMLCAAPEQETERYKLGKPSTFRYLNQSNCYALDGLDDSKEYLATRKAMDVVGIDSEDQDAIFRVVAAILHLGNIEFAKGEESEASEPKDEKSRFHLKTAAELFMCDEKALEDSLCKRVMVTRDESITKSLDPDSAALGRDALAKIVYSKLFDWLVTKINNSIGQDPDSKHIIGVLDIYGFESFKTNSFEQFCINLTNEKLQQHFNQHVFKMEQEEYTKEEIDWSYIEFIDNQDILDLIEKKPGGIIALLDEACMFPRSTHDTFAQKLYQTFKDHKRFSKPKLAQTDFTICHYAGDVTYQTELFLDKNKDYVVGEHQALLSSSDCSFHQLQSLLESLSTTEPHYIRCVKPNNLLKPEIFENNNILQQLRCGGVMEAIRISCAGYPTRKPFNEFLTRFKVLAPETTNKSNDEVDACKKLLAKVDLKGFQIGKTKVFLRAGQMAELDAHRAEVLGRSARIIQRKVLSYQSRKKFLLLQAASTDIQALCRGQVARVLFEKMRIEVACLRIQNQARTYICQKAYKSLCSSACSVQTGMRAKAARVELQFRKKRRAAIIIQASLSSHNEIFISFYLMKKAAITTQCGWRRRVARRELRNLKMAAKEAGALQDAKSKLENQLEELTSKLELEKKMRMEVEEAKSQEVEALQSALTDMKLQLRETQETKSAEISRLQSALQDMQLEIEELSKGLEMSNDLSAENEQLKDLVSSLEKKIDETEKKYEEASRLCEERLKQAVDAETKLIEAKTSMLRFYPWCSFFSTASGKGLRHGNRRTYSRKQALVNSTSRKMSPQVSFTGASENGHHESPAPIPAKKSGTESSRIEQPPHESVDVLIKCVSQNVGFSHGKPVAALTIYKCLIHWKIFEADKTSIFDRIVPVFGSAIENQEDDNHLAYWLTNTSTLLFLLQRSLRHSPTGSSPTKPPQPTSFLGRMTQGFRSTSSPNLSTDVVHQVDARYPALLFKQQLTAYVETMYGIIRENFKREVSSLLSSCIELSEGDSPAKEGQAAKLSAENSPANSWQSIIGLLNHNLFTWKKNYEVKAGLDEFDSWCSQATEEFVGSSWDELKPTRQAVVLLVSELKSTITYDDLTTNLCPVLSTQQLYRICTLCNNEDQNDFNVSPEVISNLKLLMTNEDEDSRSFLLDDDSSIPFETDEIANCMQEKDFANVKSVSELADNPNFQFLND